MNKKILYIIIALLIISLIILVVGLKYTISTLSRIEKEKKTIIDVVVQPQGEIDYIPKEVTIRFSKSFPGVEGVIIEEEVIDSFVHFNPQVRAFGKWISESTFEIYFLEDLKLDKWYEVEVFRIPLLTRSQFISPIRVKFKTPAFKVLNITLEDIRQKKATISIEFNFPPSIIDIRKFIRVLNSRNRKIEIIDIKPKKFHPEEIIITVPVEKTPERYTVIVKKNAKSIRGYPLKKEFRTEVAIGFSTNPLQVLRYNIEESEEGYMVRFTMTAPKEEKIRIVEKNLKSRIRIEPPISFRVNASDKFIFIFADFIPEKTYRITLKRGIKTKKGSELFDDYSVTIKPPKKRETVRFLYRGRYLGKSGEWKIPLKISQIDSLKIDIIYMPPSNVLFWHLKDWGRKWSIRNYGEYILRNHKIEFEGKKTKLLWINLKDFIPHVSKGVYLISATGIKGKRKFIKDEIAVVISELSLVIKWDKKNIYVWAFNSRTLKPEQGVKLEIRSRKNFLTGSGKTDANGFCIIPILKRERDVYIVYGEKGDEWTYVHIPSLRIPKENYDVIGESPEISYLAYIYLERDLYRPGEEINFAVLVREPGTFHGVSLPIRVTIRDPKGNRILSLSGKTDDSGLKTFSFPTTPASPTGKYLLELYVGDRFLASKGVFVETFAPERLRIEVKLQDKIEIYKKFLIEVKAEYLFGAPAAEDYTLWIEAQEIDFKPKGYSDYSFGMYKPPRAKVPYYRSDIKKGKLDEKGTVNLFMNIPSEFSFNEPVSLTVNVTVTEGGSGRVTSKKLTRIVHTKPFYIGLKSNTKRVIEGKPFKITGILLKPDGLVYKKGVKLTYKIYRLYYSYSYHYYYDDYYWESRIQKIPVTETKEILVKDGKFNFSFIPKTSYNDYLIEVRDEKNETITQIRIAGWGWWYRYEYEEKVESPEVIPIRVEKREYDEEEIVNVEALIPFEGKILWTCELDTIYYKEIKEARGEIARWSFRAPKGISTCYVSAFLFRSGDNYLVQRAFGIEKIRIRPKRVHLELDIKVPNRIRPGEELVIKIKGNEKFKGTIAVVDEGILQITSFKTPDPYNGILKDMGLIVNTSESFGWIIKKFIEKTGGGLVEREKEFPEARFTRIVSFWSGILESNLKGDITYKIKIPQYHGRLRIMAVGVNKERIGYVESDVIVKSDVIVSPTIPRFMYTNDDFEFPITLINTTQSKKKIEINIKLKGAELKGKNRYKITLPPSKKEILWVRCKALNIPGSIKIEIEGKAKKERYYEEFEIPLYPDLPYITKSEYISVKEGKTELTEYFKEFYPRAHTANLILSHIPAITRLNHIKHAIRYPYGCIEQTSTSTFLLIRLSPILSVIAPDISMEKYRDMITSGIRRIISMQTPSGGFSFWPGRGKPAPWASAYATFVLLEAEKAGFFVPKPVLKAALNYIETLSTKTGFMYYVLAKGGYLQKNPDMIDRLISLARKEKFDIPSGLWICGAIYEAGKKEEAKEFLEVVLKKEIPLKRRHTRDFYSPLQYKGMKLYMLQLIEPEHEQIETLLINITRELSRNSHYYTTQELAWCMLSIGMYAEKTKKSEFSVEFWVDKKKYKPKKGKIAYSWSLKNIGGKKVFINIRTKEKLFLCIENTGFSKKEREFIRTFNNLYLKRAVYSYGGQKIEASDQGELIIIRTGVWAKTHYRNVAIEVPIPAGLEIENPRLGRNNLPSWIPRNRKIMNPEYVDIRDDRIIIFGNVKSDTLVYYMLTRAVTPGKFFFAPVRGVVMYNPDVNAHTDASYFKVNKK